MSATDSDQPTPTIHVDPQGDLTLTVGENSAQKTLIVNRQALCFASPVLNAMLRKGGPFAENSAQGVTLPDDSAGVMLIILRIAHLQFDQVPKHIGWESLVSIMVLVDKYDMLKIVQPFMHEWNVGEFLSATPLGRSKVGQNSEECLSMAWTLRDKEVASVWLQNMIMNVKYVAGVLCDENGRQIRKDCLPSNALSQ